MAAFPSKAEILDFIQSSPSKVGKREIARAFGLKGGDRIELKAILREMADEGMIDRGHGKSFSDASKLPAVSVIDIIDQDTDGELIGRPVKWDHDVPAPKIMLAPGEGTGKRGGTASGPAIGIGDRVLARLKPLKNEEGYEARIIKRLGQSAHKILGVFREGPNGREGRVQPVDRKSRYELSVDKRDMGDAKPGDLVSVEMVPGRRSGFKQARIVEVLGKITDQRSVSLIAIHSHGIPTGFSDAEEEQTQHAKAAALGKRTDLRTLPLITIDPVDARDFDDAVHAEPDTAPDNKGGWIVTVAIADVAHYVQADSPLDRGALKRGNSCYFPDRVVPMLPERLSNELCSLRPNEERPCMAVRMVFDAQGEKKKHKFIRGLMKSHARLTYAQAQDAIDGKPDGTGNNVAESLLESILKPLWAAYHCLAQARDARAPLDLDLPEHKIEMGEDGNVKTISLRDRFDAHRLIEEFMIQANVCAAETLEAKKTPLIFRVHEPPAEEKILALRDFLHSMDLNLPGGQVMKPQNFNGILKRVKDTPNEDLVNTVVLRSQSQAIYSKDNGGHFGLNLRRYAHFTSPIRRYADLIVHRALIRAEKLGPDGLSDEQAEKLASIAETISTYERRAMAAERDSTDRFIAAFLSDRVGANFKGRIAGVTRFGLFIRLDGSGADGIVPMRALDDDYYWHDEATHALIGERKGGIFRLGQRVDVRLVEATPLSGGLRFEMLTAPLPPEKGKGRRPKAKSGKPRKQKFGQKPNKKSKRKKK